MLATLLESRGRSPRRRIAMAASAIAHCVLLIMLVMTRARGDSIGGPDDPEITNLVYVEPQGDHAPSAIADPRTRAQPSVVLPTILPPIVLDHEEITPAVRVDLPSGSILATFPRGGLSQRDSVAHVADDVMTAMSVDLPVVLLPGQRPPHYPAALERAGIPGTVIAQFVVDTAGHVENGSVVILQATHRDFANAVASRLKALRFVPARAQGRHVRQLVEQPFQFAVVRR